jgi:hypothetical protein
MDEQSSVVPEDDPPLVLRKVPPQRNQLARSMIAQGTAAAGGTWWELVDAAAAPELPAVAVALTDDVGGCVTVSALGARHADAGQEYAELLRGLVAALRSHASDAMIIHTAEPVVARALLEVGFLHTPDRNDGNRYLIML